MVWTVMAVSVAALIYLAAVAGVLRRLASAPLPWQLLGWSGVPLVLSGFGFVSRFWIPTAGPYIANKVYPFGGHLHAWAVAFGFTWVAFALLFTAAALMVSQNPSWQGWSLLLASWILCVFPHAIIAIAFAWNGANRESIEFYRNWSKSSPVGLKTLISGTLLTLWHFSFCIAGFIGTARQIFRKRPAPLSYETEISVQISETPL